MRTSSILLVRSWATAAVVVVGLLAACSSGDVAGGQRIVDPSVATAAVGGANGQVQAAPAISCSGGDAGDSFALPFELEVGDSLELFVEIRDQAGSEGEEDLVRGWPATVTVTEQLGGEWLLSWEAKRSALDLPVGFSTSDANDLQSRGLPVMPAALYRVSSDGEFLAMHDIQTFGGDVAEAVRQAVADEADASVQESLFTLSELYADAPSSVFEIALTEAQIFHEFAMATFAAQPTTTSGSANASAFLLEPVTTQVTTQLDASLAERGCVAVTKRWTITPEERGQEAGRPILEGEYIGLFDSSGQPAEVTQIVTLVRQGDDDRGTRSFTTTVSVTSPWG